jgi:hypothetical protein
MTKVFGRPLDLEILGPGSVLLEHRLPLQAGFESGALALAKGWGSVKVTVWVLE